MGVVAKGRTGIARLAAGLGLAMVLALGLGLCRPGWALTTEEVIRLKNAGVSDETIQKMIEQEKRGGGAHQGPVSETRDQIIYRAGPSDEEIEQNRRRERRKEERSLDALDNVIIDQRRGSTPPRRQGSGD
jgi:hypothetical protein